MLALLAITGPGCNHGSPSNIEPSAAPSDDSEAAKNHTELHTEIPSGDKPTAILSAYSEVVDDYTKSRTRMLSEGRAVVGLLIDNDIATVYSRFNQKLKETLSLTELQSAFGKSSTDVKPLGKRLDDGVWPISYYYQRYAAEHVWKDETAIIRVGFDENFNVSELKLLPQQALPPDPGADYETQTVLSLPFAGLWWVYWGGQDLLQNYHVSNPTQRHACDLLIWKDGGTHRGTGSSNGDFWAFRQPVLAPAEGTVVTVLDGLKDNEPRVPNPEPHPAGNHVVIKTGIDEYVFIAHFKQGSIRVQTGDKVKAGDLLGLTGNSGRSFEPHIHIHMQSELDYFSRDATGLPLVFSDYVANGQPVSRGSLVHGQFVRSASHQP